MFVFGSINVLCDTLSIIPDRTGEDKKLSSCLDQFVLWTSNFESVFFIKSFEKVYLQSKCYKFEYCIDGYFHLSFG